MKRLSCFFLTFCFFLFLGGEASATIVPQMPLDVLIDSSSLIFTGEVLSVDEHAYDEETDNPQTIVTLAILDILYGSYKDSEITFTLPTGYNKDDSYFYIADAPIFLEGEEYLIFFRNGDWNYTPVVNWYHSVFRKVIVDSEEYWINQFGDLVVDFDFSGVITGKKIGKSEREKYIEKYFKDLKSVNKIKPGDDLEPKLSFEKNKDDILDTLENFIDTYEKSLNEEDQKDKKINLKSKKIKIKESEAAPSK